MCKHKAFSNLCAFDYLALDWPEYCKYTVIEDDQGISLMLPSKKGFVVT